MTACDLFSGWFFHHGALRLAASLAWGLQMLKEDARRLGLEVASNRLEQVWRSVRDQPQHLPYAAHPAIADPVLPSYVRDWFAHTAPGEFWSAMDVSTRAERITIPALHVSGWYDLYCEGSVRGFDLLRRHAGSRHARQHQYLLAGPWVHIPWSDRVADRDLGPEALLDTDALLLRWFDHWLRDSDTWTDEPPVRHFVLGANRWQTADDWRADATHTLFLRSNGRAESRKGDGQLSAAPATAREPCDLIVVDPEVPVLAPGGLQALSGPWDQAALEGGNNVLVYTTEPLAAALHVFGAAHVHIFAATSASCADLTAKLVRVEPAGRAEFVCIGIARSAWLFGERYRSDTVHCWEFDLEPTSCLFRTGDCIRIEIAGGAFPLYDRNPGNSTPPGAMTSANWSRSTHRVHHCPEQLSRIDLPVVSA